MGQTKQFRYLTNAGTLENLDEGIVNNNNGGSLTNSGTLYNKNSSTLNNNNGGSLTNFGTLNNENSSNLNNNNGGSLTNSGTLYNSSTMSNSGTLYTSGTLRNNGTLYNFSTGTLNNSGYLYNDIIGAITGTGTYTQTAGQTINNGSMTQSSILINGGSLSGTGSITGKVNLGSSGTISPGNSPGTLTINGNFISSGNLVFEIKGESAGDFDVLDINGNAGFNGGKIEFDFINGFKASAGDTWDFLLAKSITGWHTLAFKFEGLDSGLGWTLENLATGGKRLAINAVPVPSAFWLLGSGLIGLAGLSRRQQK